MSDTDTLPPQTDQSIKDSLVEAALLHVVFDGWSQDTLNAAAEDIGVAPSTARALFPRGGVDLALAFHRSRDAILAKELAQHDVSGMRYSERVAHAVFRRLEIVADAREEVRRASSLFALPQYLGDGAKAVWETSDTIWNGLGDTSTDHNWYTKRATLSAVYSSCVLYWLGDDSEGFDATRAFVDRRIDDVMRIEKVKAKVRENPLGAALMKGPNRILDRIQRPGDTARSRLPGWIRNDT